jgi:drug/metabolite transporter (DMT)-like permease
MAQAAKDQRAGYGIALGIASALLFGASTPAVKVLLALADPWLLAGILYLGAGFGLAAVAAWRRLNGHRRYAPYADLAGRDWLWLAGAIGAGGMAAPVLLLIGLQLTPAATTALLLNLESVFTAGLAVLLFGERIGGRAALGIGAVAAGGAVLSWEPGAPLGLSLGAAAVAAACLAWGVDNNLTRRISGGDAIEITALKGTVAGSANTAIALALGAAWPDAATAALGGVIGFISYGVSLAMFVVALRHVGAARTGACFASAPFAGALLSIVVLGEAARGEVIAAGALMAAGMALIVGESRAAAGQ